MRLFIFGILLGVAFDASVTALAKDYLNRSPHQQHTLSTQTDQIDETLPVKYGELQSGDYPDCLLAEESVCVSCAGLHRHSATLILSRPTA